MAAKNSVKTYVSNAFYHIYNRGVEKRDIFLDEQDYSVFCSYLKNYLLPKNEKELLAIALSEKSTSWEKEKASKLLQLKNFYNQIYLHSYALLPNHFHLLVQQKDISDIINSFMNALGTKYAMYFNRRYKRVGPLFQGVYKAVLIESTEQLLHLTRYIHLNPLRYFNIKFENWTNILLPFSLAEYLELRTTSWVTTDYVLGFFKGKNPHKNYADFVSSSFIEEQLANLTIEDGS